MTLSEVSVALINLLECRKFIVAQLTDTNGTTKMVVRACSDSEHAGLCNDLQMELRGSGIQFDCLGGGIIWIDSESKKIKIGGESIDYGPEPNRRQTAEMIQAAHPDFQVVQVKPR